MSSDYQASIICSDDLQERARTQERHYLLFSQLQKLQSELPLQYQQRMPYELLSGLANCLLDDTIGQIVLGLKEIQQMLELNLYEKRARELEHLKACRQDLKQRNKEAVALRTITSEQAIKKEHEFEHYIQEETRKLDMKIINELDQNVSEQQATLEQAGVPGFFVTNQQTEIRIQMFLLDFIVQMSAK